MKNLNLTIIALFTIISSATVLPMKRTANVSSVHPQNKKTKKTTSSHHEFYEEVSILVAYKADENRLSCAQILTLFSVPTSAFSNLEEKEQTNLEESSYECNHCGKKLKNLHGLNIHKAKHCKTAHACTYCDESFSNADDLASHEQMHPERLLNS